MLTGITPLEMADCLVNVRPADLLALELLRQLPTPAGPGLASLPANVLTEATTQLIAYMKDCQKATHKLYGLPPTALHLPCPEFGL